ncbi:MAG: hypothetical protein J7L25_12530 [Deltaproteobacteria bacterium]|nr:hypothetical protein [Candidatus Tharpella aukensis]
MSGKPQLRRISELFTTPSSKKIEVSAILTGNLVNYHDALAANNTINGRILT